jgi:Ca2+-binding EF-hand superfamily protein
VESLIHWEKLLLHSLQRFKSFLRAREDSLQQAFDAVDANGDGWLSPKEVKSALHSVRFTCPESHCNYHCKEEVRG